MAITNMFKLSKNKIKGLDLTPPKDQAIFLPSISAIYAKIVSMPEYNVRGSMPEGLINGRQELDFLNPNNNLFYYPAALYSAGHAYLDIDQSNIYESMIHKRNKSNTIMLGDSGGFQIATGVLKWPWEKKKDQTDQDWSNDKDVMRMKILRWLETSFTYSMCLDVPTYGLVKFGFDSNGVSRHPGVKSFNDCLNESLENYAFFIKHRTEGATRFLNVLQGRDQTEGDIWWDAVKDLPFEDWAFSNVQASNFAINLRRLIIMRDEKRLDNVEWLHYLGNGKIKAGCALTTLQRAIRKYINPNITLSFDAASPFVMTAKGQWYHGYDLHPSNMRFKGGTIVDDKLFKNSKISINDYIKSIDKKGHIIPSNIGEKCSIGDICVRGYEDLKYKKVLWTKKEMYTEQYLTYLLSDEYKKGFRKDHTNDETFTREYIVSDEYRLGDKFKFSKEYLTHLKNENELFNFSNEFEQEDKKYQIKWPSSMDGFSYLLAMNHNVELHIRAIQEACEYQDSINAKDHITQDLVQFKEEICDEIFKSQTPMDVINKHERLLRKITGMDAENDLLRLGEGNDHE